MQSLVSRWWNKDISTSATDEVEARRREKLGRLTALRQQLKEQSQKLAAAAQDNPAFHRIRRTEAKTLPQAIDSIRSETEESAAICRTSAADTSTARQLLEATVGLNKSRASLVEGIIARVETSAEAMGHVAASVKDVEQLLGVIEKLGKQVNLLALNASIEAARAGVHGAGFGVVALEMRKLADSTALATEQIFLITEGMRLSTGSTSAMLLEARQIGRESREVGSNGRKNLADCITAMLQMEKVFVDLLIRAERQETASGVLDQILNFECEEIRDLKAQRNAFVQMTHDTMDVAARILDELQQVAASAA